MKKIVLVFVATIGFFGLSLQGSLATINDRLNRSGSIIYRSSSAQIRPIPVGISGVIGEDFHDRVAYRIVCDSPARLLVEIENRNYNTHTISLVEYDHLTRMVKRRTINGGFKLENAWYREASSDEKGPLSSLGDQIDNKDNAFSSIYFATMDDEDLEAFESFLEIMMSEKPFERKLGHPGHRVALRLFGIGSA